MQPTTLGQPARNPSFTGVWPWAWLAVLEVGALVAFFGFEALPFQDLPAHAGLIALRDRLPVSPFEHRYWVFAPHVGGYSLFRWLGHALAVPFGPLGAVRVLAAMPCLAFPAALLYARRRLYGELQPGFGFLGILLSFGLMTLLGFASYLIALGVLIVSLTWWLELLALGERSDGPSAPRRWLTAKVAVAAAFMVVAHGFAFVVFLVLCAATAVATGRRTRRVGQLALLAPALGIAAWSTMVERSLPVPAGSVPWLGHEPPIHFQGVYDKLSLLFTPTLMTRWGLDIGLCIYLWVFWAWTLARVRRRPAAEGRAEDEIHVSALAGATGAALVLFAVLPHSIHWFGFVDGRLVPLVLMLGFLTVPRRYLSLRMAAQFDRVIPLAATVMIVLVLVASYSFQAEARGYREVLAEVPTGSRLLNLPLAPNSDVFTAHPFVHYDKLPLVERPLLVSDVWIHQGSALYPTAENPTLSLPPSYIESNLVGIEWPSYKLEQWDYVLIRTNAHDPAPSVPEILTLVRHEGGWWLYRSRPAAPTSARDVPL